MGQILAYCSEIKLKRISSLISMLVMLFPSILDAVNKENHVAVVYIDSGRPGWMLYRMHCFRTEDHQKCFCILAQYFLTQAGPDRQFKQRWGSRWFVHS
jgi:hypothetical protein